MGLGLPSQTTKHRLRKVTFSTKNNMIPMNLCCMAISLLFASSLLAAQNEKFRPIDLSAQVQKRWADFQPGTTWAAVPQDAQTLKGVPFQLDGTIEVTGMGAARDGQPKPAQAS